MAGNHTSCKQQGSMGRPNKAGTSRQKSLTKNHIFWGDKCPGGRQRKLRGRNLQHLSVTCCSLCPHYNKISLADKKIPSWSLGLVDANCYIRIDKQWGPTVQHREPYPDSCDRRWWRIILKKMYVSVWLGHFAVQQKLARHYKSTIHIKKKVAVMHWCHDTSDQG